MGRRAATTVGWIALLLIVACTAPESAGPPSARSGPAFPRTAVYFLAHEDLPSPQTLARYDVVILDSEWDNRLPRDFFTTLRTLNSDVTLLAYVNVVDRSPRLGSPDRWADRYALWQFTSPTQSRFPDQWLARSSDGTLVSEFADTTMTNLTDQAPRVNGQTFAEYAADWMVEQVWSSGVWDGIFLDVWGDRIYGASRDHWDIDGDGTDEPDSAIYGPGLPWERGIDAAERTLRHRMPDAILVANSDRTLRDGQLDGRVWESFADQQADRDPADDLRSYLSVTAQGAYRRPGMAITISKQRVAPGSPEDFRRARFFLTGTLLQNGYWAPMGTDYGHLASYDELGGNDLGGLGPGYLGYPIIVDPTFEQLMEPFSAGIGQLADGLFRRDFEHGIVLHNTGPQPRTITLDRPYRKLTGTLDPATNNGRVAQTVTIPTHDGLILLRNPP
ncbi:MAG: putative glycoside hydrolase [Pseudonocardiaceae bacterium]